MIQAAVMHRDLTCSRLKVVSALGANKRAEGGVSLNVAGSLLKVFSHEEIRRFRWVNRAIFPNSYTHLRTPPPEGIVTGKRDAPGSTESTLGVGQPLAARRGTDIIRRAGVRLLACRKVKPEPQRESENT